LRPIAKSPRIFAVRHVPLRLVAVLSHVPKMNVVGANPIARSNVKYAKRHRFHREMITPVAALRGGQCCRRYPRPG
jgi:hypothetical protein